jgi:hypothetical protein
MTFDAKVARDEILGLLNRAPQGHSRWTHGQAVDFKKMATEARRTARNTRATRESLESTLFTVKRWYDAK